MNHYLLTVLAFSIAGLILGLIKNWNSFQFLFIFFTATTIVLVPEMSIIPLAILPFTPIIYQTALAGAVSFVVCESVGKRIRKLLIPKN